MASIAAAIEEQSSATQDMARNIGMVSIGVMDANQKVSQTWQVSGEIRKDIEGVNRISGEMARGSEQLLFNSGEISKVAEDLKASMSRFEAIH